MSSKTGNAERIWQTVLAIPEGKVASYGQIADLSGLPGRARYVSRAMGQAPKNKQLPWHRVLRSNGQIAFPAGSKMAITQSELLRAEGVEVFNNRIKMSRFGWQPDLHDILAKLEF